MRRRRAHCSHCGEMGHNQRGCEKLKTFAAANPSSYAASKLNAIKEANKHRRCSYCASEGHNKTSCKTRLDDRVKIAAANIQYRQSFIENIIEKEGISPGALVQVKDCSGYIKENESYQYNLGPRHAMVTKINFDLVRFPGDDCQVELQFFDVLNYRGAPSIGQYRLPVWYVLGKPEPLTNRYDMTLPFCVVSRSHYNFEDKESWIKDSKVIVDVHESLKNHLSTLNALNKLK